MRLPKLLVLTTLVSLAGCSTLPTSGPTGSQVLKSAQTMVVDQKIEVVEVGTISDLPGLPSLPSQLASVLEPPPLPTDLVGAGDVLEINIYEAGVPLFSSTPSLGSVAAMPGVQVQKLPPIRVDDQGGITLPYVGRLQVAYHSVREVEAMVRQRMRGMSQNPQVLINVVEPITNTIIVGGEVGRPGRLVLHTNRERLSDVIALAGGARGNAKDLLVRVIRGDRIFDVRLNDLVDNPSLDMRILPSDRLTLINDPRTFSVLGASGAVSQIAFSRSSVSIVEALANAGGVSSEKGDPASVFLFRFERDNEGKEVPRVYHLNMMNAGSFFLAQRFIMKDKDVLYVGNAASNQPGKLMQLIGQMFTPFLAVLSTANAVN